MKSSLLDNNYPASQNDAVLREYLTPDLVATKLPGKTKSQVIEALLEIACRSGKVSDCELAKTDLLNHEREISTGMENGLAIPHAKSAGVEDFVMAIGVSKKRIDFESLDKKPAQVFVLTLSPIGSIDPHLRFLTEICTILKDKAVMSRVVAAKTNDELYNVFAEAVGMEKVNSTQE
ncbi:MAG: PTS sugar transporter subunit IIA [Spirochaeta sp.]|nr:PTS sugar transporter subunit IIA [Spirochaeta sp.]